MPEMQSDPKLTNLVYRADGYGVADINISVPFGFIPPPTLVVHKPLWGSVAFVQLPDLTTFTY